LTIAEIAQEIRDLTDADSTSYSDTTILRRINSSIEILVSKIIQVCGSYPYDDDNQGDLAEGNIALQEGVSKYTITDKFLTILEVKVKDTSGVYHIVKNVNQGEDNSIVETEEATTGLPTKYRMTGRTIFLRPAPTATAVTLATGLLFKYTRVHTITCDTWVNNSCTAGEFYTGTLIPGIATPFHPLIAKMTALPYNKIYHPDRVPQLERDILIETDDCISFYANRLKDRPNRLSAKVEDNR
jgi:hypothetical protein